MARVQLAVTIAVAVLGLASAQFYNNQFAAQQPQQYSQRSSQCPEANGTFSVAGQCDAYIECFNGVAEEKLCPDGLLFNDKLGPKHFPCQYPIDVSCDNRAKLQAPQPSDECPHQFGYFKMGDRVNCGQFMNCVNGRGFMFDCPEGLAFSQETYRCEWPDMVSDCDAEAFVGFTCPPEPQSDTVTHFQFHRNAQDCQIYYLCLEGRPRMYRCKEGTLFDTLTNTCEAAENVTTCGNAAAYRTPVKPVPVQVRAPVAAPVQQHQRNQGSAHNFNQFSAPTAAPVAPQPQFNNFGTFQQRAQPTQKPAFQFTQFSTPTAAPKQAAQFNGFPAFSQPTQKPFQFNQFSAPAAPAPQFNTFQAKSFNTQAPAEVVQTPVEAEAQDPFIDERFGAGVLAPVQHQAPAVQPLRTTQPESPRPETRSQLGGNVGQFNYRVTGRGSKKYQNGGI